MQQARVVWVSGGSRGIGAATVRAFVSEGWRVVSTARTAAAAGGPGVELALACDVRDDDQVREVARRIGAELGRLDAVVCCAGVAGPDPFDGDVEEGAWHRIIDVNLHGTWRVLRHALPLMGAGGRMITVGSVLSLRGVADQPAYCASKHAVLGLTRSLAHRLGPRDITVNCICPGWTRTDMAVARWDSLGIDSEQAAESVPLNRVVEPDEVAAMALYLTSSAARSITGQALVVDGGFVA